MKEEVYLCVKKNLIFNTNSYIVIHAPTCINFPAISYHQKAFEVDQLMAVFALY